MRKPNYLKYLPLIILIVFSHTLFSQKNLVDATLMTKEGIELNGFINYQQWEMNPSKIDFYKTVEGDKEIFTPDNTIWFMVLNDYYKTKNITYTKSSRNANNLSYDKTYPQYNELAFCLMLVDGNHSLFEYTDKWAIPHYFIETEEKVVELVYYQYFVKQGANQQKAIVENNKYRGQLNYLLSDCPEVKKKTSTVKYESEALKKLIGDYNKCKGTTVTYFKKEEKPKLSFGVTAGVSFTMLAFVNPDQSWDFLTKSDLNTSVNPTLGGSLYVTPKRGNGKFIFQMDFLYKSHYFIGEYREYNNKDYYIDYTCDFGASYLKWSNLVRYNFVGGELVPYVAGGVYMAGAVTSRNTKTTDKHFYYQHTIKTEPLFDAAMMFLDYGLLVESGINYEKFNLGLRYEVGGVSQANSYTNTIYILVTYLF